MAGLIGRDAPSTDREDRTAQPHTPGPWSIVEYGDGDSLVIHAGDDWRVCFMATPGESPGAMQRIEANARLIASAPELLEALKELLQTVDAQYRAGLRWDPETVERARAAIAHATGADQ
jgi:hypothetical protein